MLKVRCKEGYQKNTKLYFLSIKVCPILPTTKVVGMTDSLIKQSQIKTLKVYYVGGEPIIKKAMMFLKAKFCHQKYTHSAWVN